MLLDVFTGCMLDMRQHLSSGLDDLIAGEKLIHILFNPLPHLFMLQVLLHDLIDKVPLLPDFLDDLSYTLL